MMKSVFLVLALLSFSDIGSCKRKKPGHGSAVAGVLPGRIVPMFDFYQFCPNTSGAVKLLKPVEFRRFRGDMLVNAEAEVLRKIIKIERGMLIIENCQDSHHGTCEHFQTWRFGDECCTLMEKKDLFWSPIFNNIHPELRCPVHPGFYYAENISLDMDLLSLYPAPLEKFYWRIQVEAYDHKLIECAQFGIRFLRTHH